MNLHLVVISRLTSPSLLRRALTFLHSSNWWGKPWGGHPRTAKKDRCLFARLPPLRSECPSPSPLPPHTFLHSSNWLGKWFTSWFSPGGGGGGAENIHCEWRCIMEGGIGGITLSLSPWLGKWFTSWFSLGGKERGRGWGGKEAPPCGSGASRRPIPLVETSQGAKKSGRSTVEINESFFFLNNRTHIQMHYILKPQFIKYGSPVLKVL